MKRPLLPDLILGADYGMMCAVAFMAWSYMT